MYSSNSFLFLKDTSIFESQYLYNNLTVKLNDCNTKSESVNKNVGQFQSIYFESPFKTLLSIEKFNISLIF